MGAEVYTPAYPPVAIGWAWRAAGSDEPAFPLHLPADGVQPPGLPDEIAELVSVLARPHVRVDAVQHEPDLRVVAGSAGGVAALACQNGDGVRLRPIHPTSIASAVVETLPPQGRGLVPSLALPTVELPSETLGETPLRGGTLCAAVRTVTGGLRHSPVLTWFDLESGRYLRRTRRGHDGREWTVIGPADATTLHQRLAELIGGLTAY